MDPSLTAVNDEPSKSEHKLSEETIETSDKKIEESVTESKNQRASNDPRVNKVKSSASEIITTELEVHVSEPLVADASKLPTKNLNRASNDPRQKNKVLIRIMTIPMINSKLQVMLNTIGPNVVVN